MAGQHPAQFPGMLPPFLLTEGAAPPTTLHVSSPVPTTPADTIPHSGEAISQNPALQTALNSKFQGPNYGTTSLNVRERCLIKAVRRLSMDLSKYIRNSGDMRARSSIVSGWAARPDSIELSAPRENLGRSALCLGSLDRRMIRVMA